MAGKFVLRSSQDTDNPILARFYGDGITAGRVMLYDKIGNRTAFLCLIAQGARFQGDTGCAKVDRVTYAGFDIPEFDSAGNRNWLYHKGYQSKHPVYRPITFNADGTVHDTGTTLANGNKVAFHARGASQILPAGIEQDHQYLVTNKTTNTYQITELDATPVSWSTNSTGTAIFAYRADDAGLFDVDQGKPHFFPNLNFTFSGKNYIEILLPAELSNGEDEPTRTKLICRGKEVYDFVEAVDGFLDPVGVPLDNENPALIGYDIVKNDVLAPRTRFHGASWEDWRDRSSAAIDWAGGNANPARPSSIPSISGGTYTAADGKFISTFGGGTAYATSYQFTSRDTFIECVSGGGHFRLAFCSDAGGSVVLFSVEMDVDLKHFDFATPSLLHDVQLGTIAASDKLRVGFEDGVFKVYKNGVAVSTQGVPPVTLPDTYYLSVQIDTLGDYVRKIKFLPSGNDAHPRRVQRFFGDFVTTQILPAVSAFESVIALCPGVAWQDVDGMIKMLPDPNRDPVFTFFYEPGSTTPSNTASATLKKRDANTTPNYWRFSFRNKDDDVLIKTYANADRPLRREQSGGKKIESGGIQAFGVLNPSQMDRIGEAIARFIADLDFGFSIEAFLDSIIVAKGDYVNVVDPLGGFDHTAPSLQMVLNESFEQTDSVETRNFETQVITRDWYSDSAHGAVVPVTRSTATDRYRPAPALLDLTLIESSRRLPDGTYIPTIQGSAEFDPSMFAQTARIFIKRCLGDGVQVESAGSGSPVFTINKPSDFTFANDDPVTFLALTPTTGELPGGIAFEDEWYIVDYDSVAHTFKVSDEISGTPFNVTSIGVGEIRIFPFSAWTDTGIRIQPDPNTFLAGFEIENVPHGYYFVRPLTVSAGGISREFTAQIYRKIFIEGDLTIPLPPSNLDYIFDGANILFRWNASISPSVAGYIAKDEFGNLLYQGDARSFVLPARTASFTVRVFSYSSSRVVSTEYAAVTFNLPPISDWMNIGGGIALPNGTLKKNTGDGWTCGAILNHGFLTNRVAGRISYIIDTIDKKKVIGVTRNATPTSYTHFEWAILFDSDGHIKTIEAGAIVTDVGTYALEEKYALDLYKYDEHPADPDLNERIALVKITQSGSETIEEVVSIYNPATARIFPMYIGAALYSNGSVITPTLEATGDLFPVTGTVPTLQNVDNATYDAVLGIYENTGAPGGASTVDVIPANQDGMFTFQITAGASLYVGLNPTDVDDDPASIPFALRVNSSNHAFLYKAGVQIDDFGAVAGSTVIWTIGREAQTLVLRRNGEPLSSARPLDALPTQDLMLDITNATGSGIISNLRFHPAALTSIDPVSGDTTPVTALYRQAQIGNNPAYAVPEFDISDPHDADFLQFQNGKVINVGSDVVVSIAWGGITGTLSDQTDLQTALDNKQPKDSDLTAIAALLPSNDDIIQRKSGAWVNRSMVQLKSDLVLVKADVGLANVDNIQQQPINTNLTAISSLSPSNDDIIQRKGGVWTNRTIAQYKSDLSLTKTDVGLSNVDNVQQLPMSYLDTDTSLAANSDVKVPSQKAIKAYVDALAQGLDVKASCRVATTANITLSGTQTIDGVSVIAGNRVLVKDQSTGANNGIYVCAAGAWSRATDSDTSGEVTSGLFTFISEGTTNGTSGWVLTTADPITLGSTALAFSQFSGAGEITDGAGLTKTGNVLDVNVDGSTIEIIGDALRVKDAGITLAKMANMATASLIYRKTAGSGAPEVNTLATLKTDLGLTGTNSGDQTIALTGDVTGTGTGTFSTTIASNAVTTSKIIDAAVTLAKMADMATASLIYRKTAGTGAPEVNTLATLKTDLGLTGTNSGDQTITLTGDVTGAGTGSFATTIASNAVTTSKIIDAAVTLAKMANMATASLIYRRTAGTGVPEVNTLAQLKTDLVLTKTDVGLSNVDNLQQIPLSYLDTDTGLTANSDAKVPSQKAIKAYVDALAQGLDVKASCRVATTANITLSGTQTIDGVSVIANDRVLVKNQTTGANNGIYVCAAGAWSRATDSDTSAEVTSGLFTFISEGTANASSGWVLTTADPITLGSTSLAFSQFSGAGQITDGAGLTKTGNTLDVNVDGSTIEINSDILRVKDAGITLAKLANMATASLIYRKTAGTGVPEVNTLATLKTDLGLTGTNSGDQTITLTGDVTGAGTGSFAATIANSAVTLAKMANMASSSLIYRRTAGTGVPEVNTLAQLKADLHLYQIFDIRDYGALGGTTDDSTAVANAITAAHSAGGGIVFVPAGVWRANTLALPDTVTLMGVGSSIDPTAGSTLKIVGVNSTYVVGLTTQFQNVRIKDLNLDCGTSTGSKCLQLSGTNPRGLDFYCQNVAFHNGQYGVWINATGAPTVLWQTAQTQFNQCIWNNQTVAGVYCNSSNGAYVFTQLYMSQPANTHGFDLPHAGGLVINGGEFAGASTGTGVCFNVTGQHINLLVQGCQDEGMMGFLNHGVSDGTYVTALINNTIQSPITFTASGTIKSSANTFHFSDTFVGSGVGTVGVVISSGDTGVLTTDFHGASTGTWRLKAPEAANVVVLSEQSGLTYKTTYNAPVRISLNSVWAGQTSLPALEIGHTGTEDKLLLRLGRINSSGLFDQTYDFRRINAAVTSTSCRVATTANITLSGTQTIDGVSVIAGDRVLVKNQSTGANNGVYVCSAGAWSRATDMDTSAEATAGLFIFINEGTANASSGWMLTTPNPITLGTTPLTFSPFSGAGRLTLIGSQLYSSGQNGFVALDFNGEFTGTNFRANSARPASIGARQDNWLTGTTGTYEAVAQNIFVTSGADRSFTGMVLDYGAIFPDGYERIHINESTFYHTYVHDSSLSSATARFNCLGGADIIVPPGGAVRLIYSNAPTGTPLQRWRAFPFGFAPITLTGDVTGSGNSPITTTIANSAVTLAKMANMATASLIYRRTAGTGVPEVNTLAQLKTDLALTKSDVGLSNVENTALSTWAGSANITTVGAGVITLANLANMATASVFYRKTAGTGAPEVQTLATLKTDLGLTGTNSGDQTISLTGDVTGSGTGSFAATIASAAVTLAKMANMATASLIYRRTAGTGVPEVNTLAQLKTDLALTKSDVGLANVQNTSLIIGSNVQAWNAELDVISGLTASSGNFMVGQSGDWQSKTTAQVKSTLKISQVLFNDFADHSNASVNTYEALYSNTLAANGLNLNGDTLHMIYAGTTANNAHAKYWQMIFGSTTIFDTLANFSGIVDAAANWEVRAFLIRVSSTVIRYTITLKTSDGAGNHHTFVWPGEQTGQSLTSSNIIYFLVQSTTASDITAKMMHMQYVPA